MALTPSTMLSLGTPAPDFALPDVVTGSTVRLADFARHRAMLVMFLCNHCPYVKHLQAGLIALARDYQPRDVAIVGISANDVISHPEDHPDRMKAEAVRLGYPFPYLYDASQEVAQAYRAACTPDFFLFNDRRNLVYRGRFDDSRPGNGRPVTGLDLRSACDAVLAGRQPATDQQPSIGCNIKWKPGGEPEYFR